MKSGKGFPKYIMRIMEKGLQNIMLMTWRNEYGQTGIGDYYFHESIYEKDSSLRTRVEKGYILVSSDDGRKYGISGKFLQNGEIARAVAASRGLSINHD